MAQHKEASDASMSSLSSFLSFFFVLLYFRMTTDLRRRNFSLPFLLFPLLYHSAIAHCYRPVTASVRQFSEQRTASNAAAADNEAKHVEMLVSMAEKNHSEGESVLGTMTDEVRG